MKHFSTPLCPLLITACLLVSVGCWQEVHYVPKAPSAAEPAIAETTEKPGETTAINEAAESFLPPQPVEVTTEELFDTATDTSDAAEQPTEVVTDTEPSTEEPVKTEVAATESLTPEPALPSVPEPAEAVEADELFAEDERAPESATERTTLEPSPEALAVWRMASRWSLAAAVYAKGQATDQHSELLEEAQRAAETVGTTLPEFPPSAESNHEKAVIDFLLTTGTANLTAPLADKYSSQYAALATLATKSNALLLVYTPKSQQLDPLIAEIKQAAENSGLPAELWANLVSMLDQRAPFADVKREVLAFHTAVGSYLAGNSQ